MTRLNEVFGKTDNLIERRIGSAIVLVPLRPNNLNESHIFSIQGIGKNVWQLIDGKKKLGEIINHLFKEFSIGKSQLSRDVLDFVEQLKTIGGIRICQSARTFQT